jgi:hypothetical protein
MLPAASHSKIVTLVSLVIWPSLSFCGRLHSQETGSAALQPIASNISLLRVMNQRYACARHTHLGRGGGGGGKFICIYFLPRY